MNGLNDLMRLPARIFSGSQFKGLAGRSSSSSS